MNLHTNQQCCLKMVSWVSHRSLNWGSTFWIGDQTITHEIEVCVEEGGVLLHNSYQNVTSHSYKWYQNGTFHQQYVQHFTILYMSIYKATKDCNLMFLRQQNVIGIVLKFWFQSKQINQGSCNSSTAITSYSQKICVEQDYGLWWIQDCGDCSQQYMGWFWWGKSSIYLIRLYSKGPFIVFYICLDILNSFLN